MYIATRDFQKPVGIRRLRTSKHSATYLAWRSAVRFIASLLLRLTTLIPSTDYLGDIENGIASDSLVAVTEMYAMFSNSLPMARSLSYGYPTRIHKHTGLNYTFELASGGAGIDSMVAGNETRYLNHSDSKRNCEAQGERLGDSFTILINISSVILVHNTLRVALYTSTLTVSTFLMQSLTGGYSLEDRARPGATIELRKCLLEQRWRAA